MKFIKDSPPSLISINVNKVNPQLLISVFNSIIIAIKNSLHSKFFSRSIKKLKTKKYACFRAKGIKFSSSFFIL